MTLKKISKKPLPHRQVGITECPMPSALSHNIRSLWGSRNASRIAQTQTVQGDRQEGPRREPRKMQREDRAFVSHTQAWSWCSGCVGFRDQVCPGPECPLPGRPGPYLAPCCQEEAWEEIQGGPSCTRAWAILRRNCSSGQQSPPQTCHQSGCTGGRWGALQRSQRKKNLSGLPTPPQQMLGFLIQYSYQTASTFGVEIWRTGSRVCVPRIGLRLLEILLARKIFVLPPNLSEYLPTGPIPALWAL